MSLICIAGLDRTGKTTVAKHHESLGYEYIHMSTPDKKYTQLGYTGPSFLDDYISLLFSFHGKKVVLDRFWDGEMVWPIVFGNRIPLLTEEDVQELIKIEETLDAKYIFMYDNDVESHWMRCVRDKEPLSRSQFNSSRMIYDQLVEKFNFRRMTLPEFQKEIETLPLEIEKTDEVQPTLQVEQPTIRTTKDKMIISKTESQLKLEEANVINEILSTRIIKKKGEHFDSIEEKIRTYLDNELSTLLGVNKVKVSMNLTLSEQEIAFLKVLVKNAMKGK